MNNDTDFLDLMYELLTREGYRCLIGKESDRAYPVIKEQRPDLVLLDIHMGNPEAGWQVLEPLRLDLTTTAILVIVCAADILVLRAKEDALRALHCTILEKPFDFDRLLQTLARILADRDQPRP